MNYQNDTVAAIRHDFSSTPKDYKYGLSLSDFSKSSLRDTFFGSVVLDRNFKNKINLND